MPSAIKDRIINKLKAVKADYEWQKLLKNSNAAVRKMATCIQSVKTGKAWSDEEKDALRLIDDLRNELENSTETITVTDYGAGDPDADMSEAEMVAGKDSERRVADICKVAASPAKWGKLIFKIVREFKPARILELGTSLGISGSYQLAGIELNQKGELITIEGSDEVAKIASRNFKKLGYSSFSVLQGRFNGVLPGILSKEKLLDLVFIDGHHDKKATKEYFEVLYPFLSDNSLLIFDDINWSEGMKQVWSEINNDERIYCSFDLNKWGICIVNKSTRKPSRNIYKIVF